MLLFVENVRLTAETPNELAKRPAALTATEGEGTYRPVRLSAGLALDLDISDCFH